MAELLVRGRQPTLVHRAWRLRECGTATFDSASAGADGARVCGAAGNCDAGDGTGRRTSSRNARWSGALQVRAIPGTDSAGDDEERTEPSQSPAAAGSTEYVLERGSSKEPGRKLNVIRIRGGERVAQGRRGQRRCPL